MPKAALLPAPPSLDGAHLTLDAVCRRLDADRRTVRDLMNAGLLRYVRIGRVFRFRSEWIEDYEIRSAAIKRGVLEEDE